MVESRKQLESEKEGGQNLYSVTVRRLVEETTVLAASNPVEARRLVEDRSQDGDYPGVIQGIQVKRHHPLELDSEVWTITESGEGEGCPTFFTVIHNPTGLRVTATDPTHAYGKLTSDLSRRGLE